MADGHDKTLLLAALIVGGLVSVALQGRPPDTRAAISVDAAALPPLPAAARPGGPPLQTDVPARRVDLGGGFSATLMHGYVLEGAVVTRRRFWTDAVSAVSPLDLGIAWGALGRDGAAGAVSYRAGFRMISYSADPGASLPANWETQITNNHLIPASPAVHAQLLEVTPGARVRLRGYLVTVRGEGIAPWRSSTRRDDNTIVGGCEIILVRDVEILAR
jgi:hypothetical protein